MRVNLNEYEINDYTLSVRIEVEGKQYFADIHYDNYDGYDVIFLDDNRLKITTYPDWALKIQEENDDSLGYILETAIGKRLEWVCEQVSA